MSPAYILNKDKNPDTTEETMAESTNNGNPIAVHFILYDHLLLGHCLRTGMGPCDEAHRQACDERQICMRSLPDKAKENYEKCRKLTITVEEGEVESCEERIEKAREEGYDSGYDMGYAKGNDDGRN